MLPGEILKLVNELRVMHGVPEVRYANTGVAQYRANYMLTERLFHHYDKHGFPPFYHFTRLGNYFYSEEALGFVHFENYPEHKVKDLVRKVVLDMVYNDAESGWGHRDTLLDPCFNYADVGVARDGENVYVNITMVSAWIHWLIPPRVRDGVFYSRGRVFNMAPEKVTIFRTEVSRVNLSKKYYDLGEPVAMVLPSPYYARGIETIRPRTWRMGQELELEFTLPRVGGLVSVVISGRDLRGMRWEPMTSKRVGECNLLCYPQVSG
ncbi:MAG: hypothetical protein MjAS7_1079 [Metallosphaera javensis (ex Sakai et al. 2022)]|nr:MAG: hypothetical protein MjAS7_1079 [Metallosphaera javensis (ex Sakai et al. 2022)]